MAEQRPLMLPRQTDAEAANSAAPDTDRQPSWDDEGWDSYLYAVDLDYRVDWDIAHGASREDVEAMIDEWRETHEDEDEDEAEGERCSVPGCASPAIMWLSWSAAHAQSYCEAHRP